MVNDLQKLNMAIGSLEEQASQIKEFNGVLRAVNDARTEIEASKASLSSLSTEHRQLINDSYSKFDDLDKRLSVLEKKLVDLTKGQERVQHAISDLVILSPDQFELGRDEILLKITQLNFLTPAQYEVGRRTTIETLNRTLSELAESFEKANTANQKTLKSLKVMIVLGVLALAGLITYLALG